MFRWRSEIGLTTGMKHLLSYNYMKIIVVIIDDSRDAICFPEMKQLRRLIDELFGDHEGFAGVGRGRRMGVSDSEAADVAVVVEEPLFPALDEDGSFRARSQKEIKLKV